MTETTIDQSAADARDGLRGAGRVVDQARTVPPSAPPPVSAEQAELIRFSHRRQGMSIKMVAAIMRLTQAQVRLALSIDSEPDPEPDHLSGRAARPSTPTDPVVPVGGDAVAAAPVRQRVAKDPDAVTHATASGYVPIMSDAYRRRPA